MKTSGELRDKLAECFELAKEGKLSGDGLRGVIGCANQINQSWATEVKARVQLMREGATVGAIGNLPIGKS